MNRFIRCLLPLGCRCKLYRCGSGYETPHLGSILRIFRFSMHLQIQPLRTIVEKLLLFLLNEIPEYSLPTRSHLAGVRAKYMYALISFRWSLCLSSFGPYRIDFNFYMDWCAFFRFPSPPQLRREPLITSSDFTLGSHRTSEIMPPKGNLVSVCDLAQLR